MDCHAKLAATKGRHGERSAAIHVCEFGLMDCHATLAETKGRHGERSATIHRRGAQRGTAALRSQRRRGVMASAARPSIVEARKEGLPRYARSDRQFATAATENFSLAVPELQRPSQPH